MEPAKKKNKKSFSVPVAKSSCITQEATKKDENLSSGSDVNQNNNKVVKVSSTDNHGQKKKQKHEDKPKKTRVTENVESKKEKQKKKIEKVKDSKNTDEETKTASIENKTSKHEVLVDQGKDVGKRKVQRSMTDEEYDDIFMAVLQSVMKAEQDGDESDVCNEDTTEPAMTTEKIVESDEESDDARSQVIEVTVKVEGDLEEPGNFDLETEDIDKWDNPDTNSTRHLSNKESKKKEDVHKEINHMSPSKQESITKPDSTVQTTALLGASSFGKQYKVKETGKLKKKISISELPSSTSGSVKAKKKFSVPTDQGKKDKKKKPRKSTRSEEVANSAVKPIHAEKVSLKQLMLNRELEDLGTWVQCGNTSCLKWRHLKNVTDPMEIPQRWECSMNTNEACNSCDKPEEDYDESQHIYTRYTEGSVVLAKMAGYPWWPGMIEIDPDYDTYFEVAVPASMYPTKYHIVFFDKNVSRAWISIASIRPFEDIDSLPRKCKGHDYKREVNAAIKNAKDALDLPIKDRLKKFSFCTRFSGKWGHFGDKPKRKREKRKSKPGRRPNKRKRDEDEEHLVDNETLDKILNNSQSVLSDVVEMLSSIENGALDSDADPEFELEKQHKKIRKSPMLPALSDENEDCNSIKAESEEEEDLDREHRFDVLKLNSDIFTMEMDSDQADALDVHMQADVNSTSCNQHTDVEVKEGRREGETNITKSDDVAVVPQITAKQVDESSSPKKKKMRKKKSKEHCDAMETEKVINSNEKEKKPKKKKKSSEDSGENKHNEKEEDFTEKPTKPKKKKEKHREEPVPVTSDNKCENKGEEKKKKRKRTITEESNTEVVIFTEDGKCTEVKMSDEGIKEKKPKKKKKTKHNDVPVKLEENGDGSKTSDESNETVQSEVNVEKTKLAKNETESKECEKPISAETQRDINLSQTKSQSKSEKTTKKTKDKFMTLTQTVIKNDNPSTSDKTQEVPATKSNLSKEVSNDSGSQKGKTKKIKKTNPETVKKNIEPDENGSEDELDLSFDNVCKAPENKDDSDDDFMLDLNEAVEKRPAQQVHSNVEDEDSEPLDFEE